MLSVRKAGAALALLAAVVLVAATLLVSSTPETNSSSELLSIVLSDRTPVVNARGEQLELVLPEAVLNPPAEPVEQYSVEDKAILLQQVRESAVRTGKACSGPKFDAQACSMWWEQDVTVYDMMPPNGVCRGRPAWEKRLRVVVKEEPHDRMKFHVESVGWVGGDTNLAWANGYWAKFLNGKLSRQGRYSAVMREDGGHWRFFIASTIEMRSEADWTPVQHSEGGHLLVSTQQIMTTFAEGYNTRNYNLAFSQYSPHAKFPFMRRMGGTSLAFAVASLDSQKKKMSPGHMRVQVDDAQVVGKAKLTGVAHGFSKLMDASSDIYTMGKFSFLLIVDRKTEKDPWKVRYDFSPNNWLLSPDQH